MRLSVHDLHEQLSAAAPPRVLDVRSAAEYRRGHVPGAAHIPFWRLAARLRDVPATRDERLIVYCGHGPRAAIARTILRRAGFSDVWLLEGHWAAWTRTNLPVEGGPTAPPAR